MPVELAMPLFLSNNDFQNRKNLRYKRLPQPCLHPDPMPQLSFCSPVPSLDLNDTGEPLQSCDKPKKRVSFADHKGLALTMVKIFSEFDDLIDVPLSIQELFASTLNISEDNKLVLDFPQPSADYLRFRQRLEEDFVCLEHCTLKEGSMAGTVKVKNLSFEKSVKVRITFDTWKSHTDVECQYVKDTYTSSDRDTFSFEVALPEQVPPHERIEFAVFYVVNGVVYWDSNQGHNYKIVHSALKKISTDLHSAPQHPGANESDIHFDRYGSPRCSHGIFAEWPSYAVYEDLGPYY